MKSKLIVILLIASCQNQKENSDIFTIKGKNVSVSFLNVDSSNTNRYVGEYYKVEPLDNVIKITPAFLESDNLDGKIFLIKSSIKELKLRLKYKFDYNFKGYEKRDLFLGIEKDTILFLKPNDKGQYIIPKGKVLSEQVLKLNNVRAIQKAQKKLKDYYSEIINNPEQWGGDDSADFINAKKYIEKSIEYSNLDSLLTNRDYKFFQLDVLRDNDVIESFVYTRDKIDKSKTIINSWDWNFDQNKFNFTLIKDSGVTNNYFDKGYLSIKNESGNRVWNSNSIVKIAKTESPYSAFEKLVFNRNYFTIEQFGIEGDFITYEYITFKNVDKEFYLYKYGVDYTNKRNLDDDIPTKIWTTNDFGEIKFEDVTEELLTKVKQSNPK